MRKWLISLALVGSSIYAYAQSLFGSDKEAYVLMPSQVIASAQVDHVEISNSNRLILYHRVPVESVEEAMQMVDPKPGAWFLYDRKTGRTRSLNLPTGINGVEILGDDQNLFFSSVGKDITDNFYNIESGRITPVDIRDLKVSSKGLFSFAPFLICTDSSNNLVFVLPDGTTKIAKVDSSVNIEGILSSDTQNFYFLARPKTNTGSKRSESVKGTLNRSTGLWRFDKFTDGEFERLTSWMKIQDKFTYARESNFFEIQLELQNDAEEKPKQGSMIPPTALLGPASGEVWFSEDDSFVLYQDAGSLLMREIKPISTEKAQKIAYENIKRRLIKNAKMVGTAFAIYCADNDDVMPGQEGWDSKIMPYLKIDGLLKDFTYVFKGGDISTIENASKVELGYFVGPGGRAVVYLDTSARWIPNP